MAHRSLNIHERFLRHIWSNQYLRSRALATTTGLPLQILSVGTLNLDAGPDLLNARIKLGSTTLFGDVEIHRNAFDWLQHHHQEDPRYNKVVLHVVLEPVDERLRTLAESGREIPTLVLGDFLNEPIRDIWKRAILDERTRTAESIPCAAGNRAITPELLRAWLDKLIVERLELKLHRFEERLHELAREEKLLVFESPRTWGEPKMEGNPDEIPPHYFDLTPRDLAKKELWEQVMYEGVMEGLGYSKNRGPFVRMARTMSLKMIQESGFTTQEGMLEALLFGIAGLMPKIKSLKEKESKAYVRPLRKQWMSLRRSLHVEFLHEADWQFFPTRPSNFPTLRLAAAAQLIPKFLNEDLFRSIVQTLKQTTEPNDALSKLRSLFFIEPPEFWRRHYAFGQRAEKPLTPLGVSRIDEILINTIIPVALLYARVFKDAAVRTATLSLYRSFPPSLENSVTRLMERELIRGRIGARSVADQQGLIQLYNHYCLERRCAECEVGKTVFRNSV